MPVEESNEEVTECLKEKIKNGEYTIGELIVPPKHIKTTLCSNHIEMERWKLVAEKSTLPTFGRK